MINYYIINIYLSSLPYQGELPQGDEELPFTFYLFTYVSFPKGTDFFKENICRAKTSTATNPVQGTEQ